MDAIEKRARELLAAEYANRGSPRYADEIRDTELADFGDDDIAMAIRAIIAALTPPEGYVLVPVELTVEMEIAFMETWVLKRRCIDDSEMQDAWAAALAARPEVP
ncbi:hypothetical protein JAK49_06155 [Stenotrophomonas maltophilia]|uniref:hypothetical protein n=1 Tax=Stenotrophomonas maltophilia TaxID=40324 RepID=UPI000D4B4502|nr:hypothetical protein [Stenotrophomonas maltophilia]MCF3495719.1 hypothetical protein [Stenotrophomonas maltophilia]MCU1153543.1 hypothetical protein [Stenotrophomonas maltophilia]MCU1213056.1 hypothetical protein [Stenotrophomonas maltophilia]PSD20196.1 hypothetical protein C7E15_06990 [Stenotrophomonas maltophilia]